ncbi:unnamed protein product [Ambrosiozyma monospora]|uniref:diacylglycerol O-acyltransferase n=1 Tax=Ambrosiozyma monospora TaxID=43982 RepID=A0A9W6Z8P8_AMBMO|nr:unnamed protein product [Ambrosiozyma monospora]
MTTQQQLNTEPQRTSTVTLKATGCSEVQDSDNHNMYKAVVQSKSLSSSSQCLATAEGDKTSPKSQSQEKKQFPASSKSVVSKVIPPPPFYPPYISGSNHTSIKTPLKKRIETLAVLLYTSSIVVLPALYFYMWCFPIFWPFLIYYTLTNYLWDNTLATGDFAYQRANWLRGSWFFRNFANYFPIVIHKTVDLVPTFSEVVQGTRFVYPRWTKWVPKPIVAVLAFVHVVKKHPEIVKEEVRTGPRYIFGCHPHGVIATAVTAMNAEQTQTT